VVASKGRVWLMFANHAQPHSSASMSSIDWIELTLDEIGSLAQAQANVCLSKSLFLPPADSGTHLFVRV